jgi:hypothetical protein
LCADLSCNEVTDYGCMIKKVTDYGCMIKNMITECE